MQLVIQKVFRLNSLFSSLDLLCADREELRNDLKRHAFGFGDLKEDEYESSHANDGIYSENAREADGVEHHRKRVGDNDIAEPEGQRANRDADTTDPRREDLRAENVGDRAEAHNKAAEVDDHADGGKYCMKNRAHGHDVGDDQDDQGGYEDRNSSQQ